MSTVTTPFPEEEITEDEDIEVDAKIVPNSITLSADQVKANTEALPDAQRESIRQIFFLAKSNKWSFKRLAAESCISSTSLYRAFNGNYGAKLDNMVLRINRFLKLYSERGASSSQYIRTSVYDKVRQACDYALVSQSMIFIYGESHIGKTVAAQEYQRTHNHGQTKHIRLPASAGVVLMMQEIAKGCGISPESSFTKLRQRIINSLDHTNVVIVDELHQVFLSYQRGSAVKCLEVLREIHDRCGCGMVLMGTLRLKQEMTLGQHVDLLEQFKARAVADILLSKKVATPDIVKITRHFGLPWPAPEDAAKLFLGLLKEWRLGKTMKILRAGQRMARKQNTPFKWDHFIHAHDIIQSLGEGDDGGAE